MSTIVNKTGSLVEQNGIGRARAIIFLVSYHHHNTKKVAKVIAGALGAEIKDPRTGPVDIPGYDLVGFGSGVYSGKHHRALLDLVERLPVVSGKKAFIFSTSGQTGKVIKYHRPLRERLEAKGFIIVEEFNCAGWDTFFIAKLMGGIQKGHPDANDLEQAAAFVQKLRSKPSAAPVQMDRSPNTSAGSAGRSTT